MSGKVHQHTFGGPPCACDGRFFRSHDRQRLDAAKEALVATGYFTPEQVGDDVAPRIIELWSALSKADSEALSGPVSASEDNPRVTGAGEEFDASDGRMCPDHPTIPRVDCACQLEENA